MKACGLVSLALPFDRESKAIRQPCSLAGALGAKASEASRVARRLRVASERARVRAASTKPTLFSHAPASRRLAEVNLRCRQRQAPEGKRLPPRLPPRATSNLLLSATGLPSPTPRIIARTTRVLQQRRSCASTRRLTTAAGSTHVIEDRLYKVALVRASAIAKRRSRVSRIGPARPRS